MSLRPSALGRQTSAAVKMLLVLTLVLGIGYPALVWSVGRLALPGQAGGSLVSASGRVVGSSLIGQQWNGPQWFHGRPSASDYAGNTSGGSNLPPGDPRLTRQVQARRAAAGPIGNQLPPDALTASASGLDPHISPAYARLQIERVAAARHLPIKVVRHLVDAHTQPRTLGFIGEPRVNVLELNLALEHQAR
ncbi:potassium-transporting ATPase subunit KdpC [Leekyejoonella antrihumi]|uniref:Potassium-transporting ATPase KdpC subunit n=1 Tax=Leekyejoonella antrihumi TaxID=1660198 RepID=A0A563E1J5_9MICO|nr:potassium-transporting ATPase subunit KdpC [Leekyejoonella antrihumi]TWP36397.1 potassium-transporting ATPase subunit KdpC [Leekyejoonella antrihumi]